MLVTYDLCEVYKIRSGISLVMISKLCAEVRKWSEHKKHTNEIHFEWKSHDVAIALNEFKETYYYKMTAAQPDKP